MGLTNQPANLLPSKENLVIAETDQYARAFARQACHLRKIACKLKSLKLEKAGELRLVISGAFQESLLAAMQNFPTSGVYIYKITLDEKHGRYMQLIRTEIQRAKENQKDLPRINPDPSSKCLYVGRSKNLYQRMRQHLGKDQQRTYALHLMRILPKYPNLCIKITWYRVDEIGDALLQSIEDAIWESEKPAFGKKGGR